MLINDKIKQVLIIKNLSPSYLADDIGVQRSSISHILSGRNRPSLDIIQKIVRRFPEFTYEWFLESDIHLSSDDGNPQPPKKFRLPQEQSTRMDQYETDSKKTPKLPREAFEKNSTVDQNEPNVPKLEIASKPLVERILVFYTDGTFRVYMPASSS